VKVKGVWPLLPTHCLWTGLDRGICGPYAPQGGGWGGKGGNPGPLPSCTAVWSSGTLGRGEPPRIPLSVWTEVVPHHPDGVCWIVFLFFLIIRSKRAGKELVPSLQQNS